MNLRKMLVVHPRRELREIYIFLGLFSLAVTLVSIFEPIFFWQQGFTYSEIAWYYALHYLVYIFVLPFGGKFAARFGYEKSLTIAAFIFVIYFLTLALLPNYLGLYWVAALILTIHKIFFWPAYHASFARFSNNENGGTEQSWVRLILSVAGVAGPVLGGLVVMKLGFPVLFVIVAVMVLLAGLVLLRTSEEYQSETVSHQTVWDLVRARRHRRMVIGMFGWVENLIFLVYRPLFIFLVAGSVTIVGVIGSIGALVGIGLGFIGGEMVDRWGAKKILRWMAPINGLVYGLWYFATTPVRVGLADLVISNVGNIGVGLPFVVRLYKEARKEGKYINYTVAFELVLAIGKCLAAIVVGVLFILLPPGQAFAATFVIAALTALLYGAF